MRKLFPFLLFILAPFAQGQSCIMATCTAAGVTQAQVLAALPASTNTNPTVIVTIPSGSQIWTSGISYTVPAAITNLTIQGQTTVTCTGTAGTSTYACTAADNTVIEDNIPNANVVLSFTVNGSSTFRLTGVTVQGNSALGSAYKKLNGMVNANGNSPNVRMDHIHVNTTTYAWVPSNAMRVTGSIEGVMDHSVITLQSAVNNDYVDGIQVYTSPFDTAGFGDGSWSAPTYWGTQHFFFIESNSFLGGFPDDCYQGGRFVMRYNSFSAPAVIQDHPTYTSGGRDRGCRELEVYHNYYYNPIGYSQGVGMRGATALVWDNTLTSGFQLFMTLWTDRNTNTHNEFPTPAQNPQGWGYCGTVVAGNGLGSAWDGNNPATTGYPCLDGVGRGQTVQALNGADFKPYSATGPLNSVTGTVAWPQQYLEPVYAWGNNTGGAGYLSIPNGDAVTLNNRDVYYDNSSCEPNGCSTLSTGTGYGTLAQLPGNCTPGPGGTYGTSPTGSYGVAYWATNAGPNGTLYVCTSTNRWTAVYTPYTYPHPLTTTGPCVVSSVSVIPNPVSININATQQFSYGVNYTGSCTGTVTWSVTGGGSINSSGLYTAPGSATSGIVVTATSTDNGSIFGSASVTVTNSGGTCIVSSVTTTPSSATIAVSSTQQFAASVTYTGSCVGTVTWGVTGGGSINSSGLYTAPSFATTGIIITATSTDNVAISGTAIATVTSTVSSCTLNTAIGIYTLCNQWLTDLTGGASLSISATPYSGNGVEIFFNYNLSTTPVVTSISDNLNSPETCFTQAPHSPYIFNNTAVPDTGVIYVWYCPSIPAGVTSFTINGSVSMSDPVINVIEWMSGVILPTGYFESVDQVGSSGNTPVTTASISTGTGGVSAPTVNSNDLITAVIGNCGATIPITPGTGYTGITVNPTTALGTVNGYVAEAKGVTSTGIQTATATWSTGTAAYNCQLGAGGSNDTWWGAIVPLKSGTQTPVVNLSPSSLSFGNQIVNNTTNGIVVTVTNTGNANLILSQISVTGYFTETDTCSLGVGMAPQAQCQINVIFIPRAIGAASGTLSITDNAGGSPQTVPLTGAGILTPSVIVAPCLMCIL